MFGRLALFLFSRASLFHALEEGTSFSGYPQFVTACQLTIAEELQRGSTCFLLAGFVAQSEVKRPLCPAPPFRSALCLSAPTSRNDRHHRCNQKYCRDA